MPIRIGGMASGMDINQIVTDLMKAERVPLDKMIQRKKLLEYKRDDYRSMNTLLLDLRNTVSDFSVKAQFKTKTVTTSDDAKVTASATTSAGNTSYTISEATLATSAYKISTGAISLSNTDKIDTTKSLWSMKDKFASNGSFDWKQQSQTDAITAPADGTTFQLTKGAIGSVTSIEVDGAAYTVYTDRASYDGDTTNANKVLVNTETGGLTFSNNIVKDSKIAATYDYNYLEFDITTHDENGAITENFKIDGTDTLDGVINKINASKVGVNAFYDTYSDKLTLTRNVSGDFNSGNDPAVTTDDEIMISGTFMTDVLKVNGTESGGTDAIFTINGLQTRRHTNTFTIGGVTFTLKDKIAAGDTPITISTSTDIDSVYDTIKNFVDKYNETIDKVNGKITEERYRDYLPLTDEQRSGMDENEIKLWEEKAKSGMLRSDTILTSGLSQMRLDLYGTVSNSSVSTSYDQLAEIGITTSSDYRERGKLEIDEAKLRQAIELDPTSVEKLFTSTGSTNEEKGIATRLFDTINNVMDQIEERAGNSYNTLEQYSIGKNISVFNQDIDDFEDRLVEVEDRYWKQFSAMEQAMQRFNQQSAYMMQAFGGGM